MNSNYFLICSTEDDCNPTYWSVEDGWTPEEGRATHYEKSILTLGHTFPEGTGTVHEKTPEGKDVRCYAIVELPLPFNVNPWFEVISL